MKKKLIHLAVNALNGFVHACGVGNASKIQKD